MVNARASVQPFMTARRAPYRVREPSPAPAPWSTCGTTSDARGALRPQPARR